MEKQPIGIIGAMASEVELLKANMTEMTVVRYGQIDLYSGKLHGTPVVLEQCGIGKVCAAMGAQLMIDRCNILCLINTGVAGGLQKGLCVGDLVISRDVVQHDYDLTAFGYAKGYLSGVGSENKTEPTRLPADKGLKACFRLAADKILTENKWVEGTIASGDVFVSGHQLKKELAEGFGAAAAEMEGAAIGEVAYFNEKPFLIVRALSDLADQEATVSYEEFEKKAAVISANIVMEMCRLLNAEG